MLIFSTNRQTYVYLLVSYERFINDLSTAINNFSVSYDFVFEIYVQMGSHIFRLTVYLVIFISYLGQRHFVIQIAHLLADIVQTRHTGQKMTSETFVCRR